MSRDTTCTRCGLPVDLAVPHVTLVEQTESEYAGVVTVHAVAGEPRYRHEHCPPPPGRQQTDGPCDTCDPDKAGPPCPGADGWCPGRGTPPLAPGAIPAPREATS